MISVVLVDDEKPSLDELEYIISKCSYTKILGKFINAIEAFEFIILKEPDVVFLDINMPEIDGIKFAEKILTYSLKTRVIFATAYDDYAIVAFEKNALDYILKPYENDRVFRALRKIKNIREYKPEPEDKKVNFYIKKIPIWKGEKIVLINVEDVLFCKVEEREVSIHTNRGKYVSNDSLSSLEDKLSKEQFFRTHRAFLVNLSKIIEVSPYFNHTMLIKVDGSNEEIPVSRGRVKLFKEVLNI